MYADTFTASMKNTNFKSTNMQNKQRHLQQSKCLMTYTAQALSPASHFSLSAYAALYRYKTCPSQAKNPGLKDSFLL